MHRPCDAFDQIYFRKDDLAPALRGKLLRLAAFQNPEFLQAQRMRLSTYGKPRVIACGRETADYLVIPRGRREASFALLAAHNAAIEVDDRREAGVQQGFAFHGALRDAQTLAVREMLRHDDGILAAGTAFGKTVAALWLVAERNTSTLILVNRRQLLDQWIQRIAQFLGIPEKEIGRIGGGRRKDFLLQKFGYMVLRFLAGDVSRRLNDILDMLAAALHGRDDAPQSHVDHGNPRSADVL